MDLPKTLSGYDAILVVVDRLSKMAHFIPTTASVTALATAKLFVDHIFKLHGLPKSLVSDRDTRFTSKFWQALFHSLGTSLKMSTSFHPQTDGQTERTNRTLISGIRSYVNSLHTNWDSLLPTLEFSYNNTIQRSTTFSPFYLNYGFNPIIPAALPSISFAPAAHDFLTTLTTTMTAAKQHLLKAQQQQSFQANKHRRHQSFNVGDQVLLSTTNLAKKGDTTINKFSSRYIGPFPVLQIINPVTYKLQLPPSLKIFSTFHISLLKPYHDPAAIHPSRVPLPPAPIHFKTHEEYFVEAILAKRTRRNNLEYLVKWQNYPTHDNTWEPAANLTHCKTKLQDFENAFAQRRK